MSQPSTDEQDKVIELSELAGGLAHEIRNPLSTLKVNLQLLWEDLELALEDVSIDADLRRRSLQRLTTLKSETDRLQQLLDDFLKLVGRHDINTERCDLNAVVGHLVEFFTPQAQQHSIRVRLALSPVPLLCDLDQSLIKQALLNLCLNAQQAMPSGGELMIRTQADDGWAQIDLADTGIGIEPQVLGSLFKPFFSTKKGGSGLGLSLTRRIVLEHAGTIDVRSEPNRGTCFTIRIPRIDPPAAAATS